LNNVLFAFTQLLDITLTVPSIEEKEKLQKASFLLYFSLMLEKKNKNKK